MSLFPPPPPCPGVLHTVASGETLESIAQSAGITLQALVTANPQLIAVGQLLCVPVSVPCCLVLQPTSVAPATAGGTAWVSQAPPDTVTALVVAVNLASPATLGPFTVYVARFVAPSGASFQFVLAPVGGQPVPVVAGGTMLSAGPLDPNTSVLVFAGTPAGAVGPVVLQGSLTSCQS